MIIATGFQPVTVTTKSSILDVTAVLNPPLDILKTVSMCPIITECISNNKAINNKKIRKMNFGEAFYIRLFKLTSTSNFIATFFDRIK